VLSFDTVCQEKLPYFSAWIFDRSRKTIRSFAVKNPNEIIKKIFFFFKTAHFTSRNEPFCFPK